MSSKRDPLLYSRRFKASKTTVFLRNVIWRNPERNKKIESPGLCWAVLITSSEGRTLLVSLPRYADIFQKERQFPDEQCLRTVHKCLAWRWMKIHQYHVGACNHSLGSGMHDIQDAVRRGGPHANGMRRIYAHRHARQSLDHWNMRKIHEITMWISHVGLHAT